jgi:hypothetical protein
LLARERCLFTLFEAPQGLSGRAALSAALLRAQTDAPYQAPGSLITRKGSSFGIWSWDSRWVIDRLTELGCDPTTRVLPETLFQHPLDGWRVVKQASGYEAQFWSDDFLYASVWRRRNFEAVDWANFVRVLSPSHGADLVPDSPPPPQLIPYTASSPYRKTAVSARDAAQYLTILALSFAAVLICVTAFLFGQAITLNQRATALRQETALRQQANASSKLGSIQHDIYQLSALQAVTARPDPLVLVAAAQKIVEPFGFKIIAFNADHDSIKITLPDEATAGLEPLATELRGSPYFSEVKPVVDHAKRQITFELKVRNLKRR